MRSQHHHKGHQLRGVQYDIRHHVSPNTSSSAQSQTHGTGNAATNGPLSSFQTPAVAGQAVCLNPHTPRVGDQFLVPSLSSSREHTSVTAAVSSSPETCQMGHGQSKATPLLSKSSLPPQSAPGANPVLDAELATTKGFNISGKKFKRAKRKVSDDSYSETTGETITVSNLSSSPSSPPIMSAEPPDLGFSQKPSHTMSTPSTSPSSQVLGNTPVTSSSKPPALSQSSSSSFGRPELPPKESFTTAGSLGMHPKASLVAPTAAGTRSSFALSPGISPTIDFMMKEWQEPSKLQLTLDTSSSPTAAVIISPSLQSGDPEFSKATKETDAQKEAARRHSSGEAPTSPDKREMKESWRKSDSTNSHHTVRANSLRASRPVSWAESFHSAYTIVPANGGSTAPQGPPSRRLSGLIADVDFGVREEEPEEDVDTNVDGSLSQKFAASNPIQDPKKSGNLGPGIVDGYLPSVPYRKAKDLLKKANRRSISLSSALPGPMAGLLAGAKPLQPEPSVPTTTPAALPSAPEVRFYSTSGMGPFRNMSHPHVPTHMRQQSENLLQQRPTVPADVAQHAPSIAFSSSQLTSGSLLTQDNLSLQQPSGTSNLKGRLQSFLPPLPRNEQGILAVPSDSSNSPAGAFSVQTQFVSSAPPVSLPSHIRQPTISGLGPSAAGIARRAVERMSRRLGDMMNGLSSSSNSSVSGHSSSTSISPSASTSITSETSLVPSPLLDSSMLQSQSQAAFAGRTTSRGSIPASPMSPLGFGHAHHHSMIHVFGPSKSGGHKRLQKSLGSPAALGDVALGGASSSTLSSASTSESDPFAPTGPILGRRLRGPLMKGNVFGKELKVAVNETKAIVNENEDVVDGVEGGPPRKAGLIKALESRMVPAVVVRCAQHLLIWGVQEEGLFRVNGRPRHVSHLRAEFDSGADYDMTECSPSELDPHAVASVFKAYLRELPDSILTHRLQPYFDAAITKENTYQGKSQQHLATNQQGLASGPRNSVTPALLRKPPSLSTLAMPSFNQVPSRSLVHAIRSLIAELPSENRDLLRTVVDLIKATAKGSKATKMPLSNLLLLFCPSLNMSPPLLRVLCEAEGIWEEPVFISRERAEEEQLDGGESRNFHDEDLIDIGSEEISVRSGRASSDNTSSLDYHASAEEDSLFLEERAALRRRVIVDRPEIPTVYMDTRSHLSSSSVSLLQDASGIHHRHTATFFLRQEMRDDGSISSGVYSFKNDNLPTSHSPPPLSSSADSVSTPTSSANPSFSHLPLAGDQDSEEQKRSDADLPSASARASPKIVGSELGEIRKRPFISNPIPITGPLPAQYPFPTPRNREHAPPTPLRRRSIPLLSLSSLSNRSSSSSSASPSKNNLHLAESRTKKPSLKLLFSKKSSPSLMEGKERPIISLPLLQPPEPHFLQERSSLRSTSGSDSSVSTPLSAVTAPQAPSVLCLPINGIEGPPVLNTMIEDSSLKFDELISDDQGPAKSAASPGVMGLSPQLVSFPTSRSVSENSVSRSKGAFSNSPAKLDIQLPASTPQDDSDWMKSVSKAADAALFRSKLR